LKPSKMLSNATRSSFENELAMWHFLHRVKLIAFAFYTEEL